MTLSATDSRSHPPSRVAEHHFPPGGYDPPRSSLNGGARLTVMNGNRVTLSLNYDLELKKDFYSHAGYASIRFAF
jgi:hypothetical protein